MDAIECQYYTVKEVATVLGVSYQTVMEWCRDGKLAAIKIGAGRNGAYRIRKDADIFKVGCNDSAR